MPEDEERCFELSQVLREEFEALRPERFPNVKSWEAEDEKQKRQEAYKIAHNLGLSALALSGGGIRSASFALGVIQSLAESGLLRRFDYLSTVSGGGYIGSWLSAWLYWNKSAHGNADTVLTALRARRGHPDKEPEPITHLRAYSSYLTPQLGLTSADTWTAVAMVVRNLLLNWLILVPVICLVVLSIKVAAGVLHTAALVSQPVVSLWVAILCLVGAGWSLGYKLLQLYRSKPMTLDPNNLSAKREQSWFLIFSLLPAIIAGACFAWLANQRLTPATALALPWVDLALWTQRWQAGAMVVIAVIVFCLVVMLLWLTTWIISKIRIHVQTRAAPIGWAPHPRDLVSWGFGTAITGGAIWLGVYLLPPITTDSQLLLVVLGMPWFLLSMLMGQLAYVMAWSYSPNGDYEREWLGRAGGWFILAALAWIIVSGLVLLGSELASGLQLLRSDAKKWLDWLGGVGTISGLVTAFLGKSSVTPARGSATGLISSVANAAVAIAGPLFAAILLILLSVLLDAWVLGAPLSKAAILELPITSTNPDWLEAYRDQWIWMVVSVAMLAAIVLLADFSVNVNRFSLHAVYRNRLVRAFLGGAHLGAAHPGRTTDGFTGFDQSDNLRVSQLWDEHALEHGDWRPFHVINITLNLASTTQLAWQQRKAESFTVTPKSCGCANLGYRRTDKYGDPSGGITLGTAMAISGAAVSSNMGYHSSPSIAFLLTLLNVRLGWWLGNPRHAGARDGRVSAVVKRKVRKVSQRGQVNVPYRLDAPRLALRPFLVELFGLTDDNSPYIYLSDGGHFEDLGLYEMVRRRCLWILVSDADADPHRGFEDLGNAVRKIWIDLGVRITFESSDLLKATEGTSAIDIPYCALGTIEYLNDGDGRTTGKILYIKPVVRGDEPAADIIAYVRAHEDFPHQSTAEQWFDEPQLESYRVLGYWMTKRIVNAAKSIGPTDTLKSFFKSLEKLDLTTMRGRAKAFLF